jgi:hypothetical protein
LRETSEARSVVSIPTADSDGAAEEIAGRNAWGTIPQTVCRRAAMPAEPAEFYL